MGIEALARIALFVESQRTDEGAFQGKGKSGKADLYYTAFGWMLDYLLGIGKDLKKKERYLSEQASIPMDLIHYAAWIRCRMILRLMKGGKAGLWLQSLCSTPIKTLNELKGVPHNDRLSPYSQLIRLSLREDAGIRIKDKKSLTDSLSAYRISGGGYRNTKDGSTATTNATVAALTVKGQLNGYRSDDDIRFLNNSQDASGGFKATIASPIPDLLSTATALFLLSCYPIQPQYAVRDFIEAHWLDSGGFSATLLDEYSDVEYTFYGLLALGAISR